jgi:hypothetical protein
MAARHGWTSCASLVPTTLCTKTVLGCGTLKQCPTME